MTPAAVESLFQRFARAIPEPKTELHHSDPFTLLLAVVLSAQATDKGVNKATAPLFAVADTPAKILELGEEGLGAHLKTLNYWPTKTRNILKLCETLLCEHGGVVPRDRASLEALPGVGRKTASVLLNCAFGEPTIAVDTHVFRVANRLGLVATRTPQETEPVLLRAVPDRFKPHAHHWLILHGRYVCKARKPECGRCPVADLCEYPAKTE